MDEHDAARKHTQRAAYDTYQRLQHRLDRLPRTDPEYAALHAQARLAEAYWRDLMDHPPIAASAADPPITIYGDQARTWVAEVVG